MSAYVGFDPGGESAQNFGWAVLTGDRFPLEVVACGRTGHALDAFNAATKCAGDDIRAVGVDAPLFWIPAGDRQADREVRKAIMGLGSPGGTVKAVNSLRGACLIQGILVAMKCRERLPKTLLLTETHPKALLWLLGVASKEHPPTAVRMTDLAEYVQFPGQECSEHERDAVLGGIAAFALAKRRASWRDLYDLDSTNAITPLNPRPAYWMRI